MEAGTTAILEVVREAPFGYFLSDGENDVLLHHLEANKSIELNQKIEVFLYQDHQGRLSASQTIPSVQVGKYDWVEVVGVKKGLGVFIDIGLKKDILVSLDDLPDSMELWPKEGDKLFCTLVRNNKNRLFGLPATDEVMRKQAKPADKSYLNRSVDGTVFRVLLVGSSIVTDEGIIGFIHESERTEEPHLGEKITGRVIAVKEDGTINLSLLPRIHERLDQDALLIYDYLMGRGGTMPYSDKSQPEDIKKRFNMSKGSFKRALGKLLKEGKVYQEDGWTHAKK
ncbi:S1-like domain-containing RNA-binding protein [Lederbergia sp. NSJ-179]|uniref:CvfB family protein n=1 Tax=Lederbergia sp. NSJ-179 TaxID=2931402 RepID=UPI001FD14BB6|nr:S1-like domain-containing RNA-binding protein [Lederbergia sp. NSJ-179]MCJ7841690.1 S1-like domain-containing RNA-binding protein [Lederbergia sp. NSJ-179]